MTRPSQLQPDSAQRWPTVLPAMLLVLAVCHSVAAKKAPPVPEIRWEDGKPGCSFSAADDGKYRYSLSTRDLTIVLAVDSQELQKVHRRPVAMLGVHISFNYLGQTFVDVPANRITLEFVNHSHVVLSSLNPDDLSTRLQSDMDAMNAEIAHQVQRHPESKDQQESTLQAHLKDISEMIEFLDRNSLRTPKLDPGMRETNGWIFFDTRNKWIGNWKPQESFILHIQMDDRIFEFPFLLPPKNVGLILRRRPD